MFLCTCIKVDVTTLPKFSRQNSEQFLLYFWKWGKNNKPSKNFLCKNLRLNMYHDFWTSLRNHACKSTKDLILSKSENDNNAKFSKRSNFSFISLLQKIKKTFIWARRMRLWPPCPKYLVKILKTFCSNSGNDEKFVRFPNKVVSPQNVRLKCTMNIWQAWRNFVPKNTKKIPELQKCWSYNFFNKFFYHQRCFFSNEECNFDKASKVFSLKIHRFGAQIPKTTKKSGIFWNDKKIP